MKTRPSPPGHLKPSPEISVEPLLASIEQAAGHVNRLYLLFLSSGAYTALTLASITHEHFLTALTIRLPLLDSSLSVVWFFIVAPWIFLLLHFTLLLNIHFLSRRVGALRRALRPPPHPHTQTNFLHRLSPFLLTQRLLGRRDHPRVVWLLLSSIAWLTCILLPILLLLWIQIAFLPYHSGSITTMHRGALLLDILIILYFSPSLLLHALIIDHPGKEAGSIHARIQRAIRGRIRAFRSVRRWIRWRTRNRRTRFTYLQFPVCRMLCYLFLPRSRPATLLLVMGTLSSAVMLFSCVIAVLPGERAERVALSLERRLWTSIGRVTSRPLGWCTAEYPRRPSHAGWHLTYCLFDAPRAPFHRSLRLRGKILTAGEQPSADVLFALDSSDNRTQEEALKRIVGLQLRGRNLRAADLSGAYLPKVDLSQADLHGANLSGARLPQANLTRSNLSAVLAHHADLRSADLREATLDHADLEQALLDGCNFSRASLSDSSLRGARLNGASFREARLSFASLPDSELRGVDLRSSALLATSFDGADMIGADLRQARLVATSFRNTNLSLSDLRRIDRSPLSPSEREVLQTRPDLLEIASRSTEIEVDHGTYRFIGQELFEKAWAHQGRVLCDLDYWGEADLRDYPREICLPRSPDTLVTREYVQPLVDVFASNEIGCNGLGSLLVLLDRLRLRTRDPRNSYSGVADDEKVSAAIARAIISCQENQSLPGHVLRELKRLAGTSLPRSVLEFGLFEQAICVGTYDLGNEELRMRLGQHLEQLVIRNTNLAPVLLRSAVPSYSPNPDPQFLDRIAKSNGCTLIMLVGFEYEAVSRGWVSESYRSPFNNKEYIRQVQKNQAGIEFDGIVVLSRLEGGIVQSENRSFWGFKDVAGAAEEYKEVDYLFADPTFLEEDVRTLLAKLARGEIRVDPSVVLRHVHVRNSTDP